MPRQKPGTSRQDYETPKDFLIAVRGRFGPLIWDLAARDGQITNDTRHYFGPGSRFSEDALAVPWVKTLNVAYDHNRPRGWCWLNPPFARIDQWAEKCAQEMAHGAKILMLTPASIGTRWFAEHVQPYAHVIALSPRLTFVGETAPYPKDLMLSVYCHGLTGFSTWHWPGAKDVP